MKSSARAVRDRKGRLFALFALVAIAGCSGIAAEIRGRVGIDRAAGELDAATVAAGLREALTQGTARATAELGRENGFWSNPVLRIPLPENLRRIERALRGIGQDRVPDQFIRTLNRAAEQATPAARDIFVDAIRKMTIRDAFGILRGPDDAATAYFRRRTEAKLVAAFRPTIAQATDAAGVTAAYKNLLARAKPLGLVETAEHDIDGYVTDRAVNALFALIAEEERRIRRDPVARTSELLRTVFR